MSLLKLMLSQPMSRTRILLSEFAGVSLSLLLAFLIGVGIPVIYFLRMPLASLY
jgi:Cu-processing system permease protein